MKKTFALVLLVLILAPLGNVRAAAWRNNNTELIELNKKLKGKVLDYTHNHGPDNRIWSRSLNQRRDLYVYLPPNFDPRQRYPLVIFLHGLGQDEQIMFNIAPMLDHSIYVGDLPPLILAVPDGSVNGIPDATKPATFFLNTNLGDFEDYLLTDVWDFLATTFPIRSEREAHVLAGVSMGGLAAFNLGIRHRYCFGTVIGIHPPLNMRWMDENGNYMARFNPCHWGWRTNFDYPGEVLGRFGPLATVRVSQLIKPLFASSEEAIVEVSRNNPIELVERTCLRNGELQMYVGYGAHDEFNCTAQVESFLYYCKYKRIYVGVGYDVDGHHDLRTAYRLWPGIVTWLKPRLETVDLSKPEKINEKSYINVAKKAAPPPQPQAKAPVQPSTQPAPAANMWTPPHVEATQQTNNYRTFPQFDFGQSSSTASSPPGGSRPEQVSTFPSILPDVASPPTGTAQGPPQGVQIPPVNRGDLGPAARPGIPYGQFDTPLPPPPAK